MNADARKVVLTQALLKTQVSYDPKTGIFKRISGTCGAVPTIGKPIGWDNRGYLMVRIFYKGYYLHRLAWLYVNGDWPSGEIDHRDGVKTNNRIENLRDVSTKINNENTRVAQANNVSKLLGASFNKKEGKYQARISVNGKRRSVGYFKTAEEAHAAYVAAKRQLHEGCTI